ncbi:MULTISPECIES: ABC transporter ATP-binding protein [unclassified Paenibacillus]|uniref:ABC transporter ATP-binding protein n=1 Tax=unclassified Paenibacillus TaxID=185978 RepID=UPI001C10CB5C|nr:MULTISPECIES: ABC transporter ATP-binding protein [unclassified Paenibacillus]MBU5444025.1 ABC transporter ATP-binding protein [Paenibacillus sp. MSJ-34]CAH0122760.1 Carnitine transport ATP-binding protein OpuCA [Paenibacillus sp. CECT 9249]
MLRFEHVGKTYPDGFQAVSDLNFEINRGEFIIFIGPSGCGKTTTMKMINRLIPHTEGVITINGKDITKEDPVKLRRSIGYVIQQTGLFPHYTIEQNIGLLPDLKGWDAAKKKQRVKEMLDLVGLDPAVFAKRYPKELSGGQQQRVGVARALAADPEIVLMDEPFGALDPITREQLQDELLKLQQEMKKTIIFVTHDMDEALKLGDRIAVMKDGSLVQMESPETLLREPAHGFVEQFIGQKRIYQNPEYIPVIDIIRTDPALVRKDRSLEKAIAYMRQRRTYTLLAVEEDGTLLGIVSAYDVLQNINKAKTIEELVRPAEPSLLDTASAKDALMAISSAKHGIIPVVDANRKIVGIVTRGTLLTTFASHWAGGEHQE